MHAMAGIRIGVCVLMTNAILKLARKSIVDYFTMLIFIIALMFLFYFGLSPVLIVLFGILAGLMHTLFKLKRRPTDE